MAKFDEQKETTLEAVEVAKGQVEVTEKKTDTAMNVLDRFLSMISAHGVKRIFEAMLLAVLIVFLSIFMFNPHAVFKAYDDYKVREHTAAMQERVDNTPLIQEELDEFRTSIGASRAFVFELHNSTNSLDGMPFLFASMTYESVSPTLNTAAFEFDNVRLSLYKLATYLRQNEVWYGDVDEMEEIDRIVYHQLGIFNLGYAGFKMLKVEGYPNAILCFAFNEGSEPANEDVLLAKWTLASHKINGLLTLSKEKKK